MDHPLLLEPHDNKIALLDNNEEVEITASKEICNGICGYLEWLSTARASHALYSKYSVRFVMVDLEERVYAGSCEESVTNNLSLGLVQVAMVAYVVTGGSGVVAEGYGFMTVALVELEGIAIAQGDIEGLPSDDGAMAMGHGCFHFFFFFFEFWWAGLALMHPCRAGPG